MQFIIENKFNKIKKIAVQLDDRKEGNWVARNIGIKKLFYGQPLTKMTCISFPLLALEFMVKIQNKRLSIVIIVIIYEKYFAFLTKFA